MIFVRANVTGDTAAVYSRRHVSEKNVVLYLKTCRKTKHNMNKEAQKMLHHGKNSHCPSNTQVF